MGYMKLSLLIATFAGLALMSACSPSGGAGNGNVPGDTGDSQPFDGIAEDESISLTGNEPFWGGQIDGEKLLYTTPEQPDGVRIDVTRFAGRGGLSFSGQLSGQDMLLAITPGECSDTMSDTRYPYVATLRLGDDVRAGCAWTDAQPRTSDDGAAQ